jgi:oligosaccharide reducing-end xylanase
MASLISVLFKIKEITIHIGVIKFKINSNMGYQSLIILFITLSLFMLFKKAFSSDVTNSAQSGYSPGLKGKGSYFSGEYRNLFSELLFKSELEVNARVDSAFNQLFYGDDATQRVYYPVEPDMAYIQDIYQNDVRTEGMSYGMMIAVQLNRKSEFDRLWNWAKKNMQHKSGPRKNYFAWHCKPDGTILNPNSASDGEEWFVMALFFAFARWGNGEGIYNYRVEAQTILDAMLNKESEPENDGTIKNIFNRKEKQVVFVPFGNASDFTDPSYHLPHFYELWALWADKDNQFWCDAASTSRLFLKKATHPQTGLAPDYAHFDGSPINPWGRGSNNFRYDAWRVAMNVAIDYEWFAKDDWAVIQSNRLLNFFHSEGRGKYCDLYTLDGKRLSDDHAPGLIAMNAVACLASTNNNRKDFVEELWNTPVPSGEYRYYDGLLYMLAMLQVSGNFRIYNITGK